jgi:hypothetical protein
MKKSEDSLRVQRSSIEKTNMYYQSLKKRVKKGQKSK